MKEIINYRDRAGNGKFIVLSQHIHICGVSRGNVPMYKDAAPKTGRASTQQSKNYAKEAGDVENYVVSVRFG